MKLLITKFLTPVYLLCLALLLAYVRNVLLSSVWPLQWIIWPGKESLSIRLEFLYLSLARQFIRNIVTLAPVLLTLASELWMLESVILGVLLFWKHIPSSSACYPLMSIPRASGPLNG